MSAPAGSSSLGLRSRPEVDPLVAGLVAEAVFELWPRPPAFDATAEASRAARAARAERAWRFSGRWWTRPAALRRDRPWVR